MSVLDKNYMQMTMDFEMIVICALMLRFRQKKRRRKMRVGPLIGQRLLKTLLTYLLTSFLNCLLTYLLTPWSRVLLEKLTGFQLVKESPHFVWNLKVHYRIHNSTSITCPYPEADRSSPCHHIPLPEDPPIYAWDSQAVCFPTKTSRPAS
jgi:hypothetical protein